MKVFSCFVVRMDDGLLQNDHITYVGSTSNYLNERREEVLSAYGHMKLVAYFAGTDRTMYLKRLIAQRLLVYRDVAKRYEEQLVGLVELDRPVDVLAATDKAQQYYLETLAYNIGRAMWRYTKCCNEEGREVEINDELALAFMDWFIKDRQLY